MRKFFVTAEEMRDTGLRIHEEIADHTKFFAPSVKDLMIRVRRVSDIRSTYEIEGKFAETHGEDSSRYREDVNSIDQVLSIWKNRWRTSRV